MTPPPAGRRAGAGGVAAGGPVAAGPATLGPEPARADPRAGPAAGHADDARAGVRRRRSPTSIPGNFATNIQGGAKFGYLLLWVVLLANLMAMLIQYLSAKLGIVTDRNLPEMCRERFPRRVTLGLWVQAELMAMATDIAEFLGAALGLNLLFGVPLLIAGLITGAIAFGCSSCSAAASAGSSSRSRPCSGSCFAGFLYRDAARSARRRTRRSAG